MGKDKGKWVTVKGHKLYIPSGANAKETINEAIDEARLKTKASSVADKVQEHNSIDINKPMTTKQKIASVNIIKGKDSILPMLNDNDLQKIGASKNKPILVKASSFDYNEFRHPEAMQERNELVGQALYSPSDIFKGNKEGYHVFAKVVRSSPKHDGKVDYGTVLLDVNETNDNFEVVHWHYMRPKNLEQAKNKNTPQE